MLTHDDGRKSVLDTDRRLRVMRNHRSKIEVNKTMSKSVNLTQELMNSETSKNQDDESKIKLSEDRDKFQKYGLIKNIIQGIFGGIEL